MKALKTLKDTTGWSEHEIERQGIMSRKTAQDCLRLLAEPPDVQVLIGRDMGHVGPPGDRPPLTPSHVRVARVIPSPSERADVLRKAARERLTADQTRELAEAVAATEAVEVKHKILETTYAVRKEEITLRAKREVLLDQFAQVRERIPTLDERLFRRTKPQ